MMQAFTLIVALTGPLSEPSTLSSETESHRVPVRSSPMPEPDVTGQQVAICPCKTTPKSLLTIWTSRDCVPGRQFWRDLNGDRTFREALLSRFQLQWRDFDTDHNAGVARGIVSAPTFVLGGRQIVGYHGKQWLWQQLTMTDRDAPVTPSPTTSSPPGPSAPEPVESPSPLPPLPRRKHPQPPESLPSTSLSSASALSPPMPSLPARSVEMPTRTQRQWSHGPALEERNINPSRRGGFRGWVHRSVPLVLTGLELVGILGGTAATGGLGTIAVAALWRLGKRRRLRHQRLSKRSAEERDERQPEQEASGSMPRAPFPRRLDEARQLLALRQSEGRVATLDALRGMFLDDELTKLAASASDTETALVQQLKTAIDARVDEVAPLSTVID